MGPYHEFALISRSRWPVTRGKAARADAAFCFAQGAVRGRLPEGPSSQNRSPQSHLSPLRPVRRRHGRGGESVRKVAILRLFLVVLPRELSYTVRNCR